MIKKIWPQIILFIFIASIIVTNYTPETWLTGWDNLHTEFNFGMNIKRSLFAVWQEYQSFGLLGGMGHAADLPRQIFLWIVSIFTPNSLLRYFYHFLMLFIGTLGTYFLLADIILTKENKNKIQLGAFFGALFYLLNLGTIQYFYVPFEPYSTFWGLLPWEIYVLLNFLNLPNKRNLIALFIINLLAVPQSYVQTIFLVYGIIISIFLLFHIIRFGKKAIKNSIIVLFVIFIVNSFWLLPNVYFVRKNLTVNQNAWQNLMATDKFFSMNKARGSIKDFVTLKEFYYDFVDYNQDKQDFDRMFQSWRMHFNKGSVNLLASFLFIISLIGLITTNKYKREIATIFLLSCIAFLSNTPPFSWLNEILRTNSLINQLFRNPFTKMIVPTVLSLSLLFGLSISYIEWFLKTKITTSIFFVIFISIFIYIFQPVWSGNFIYKNMQVAIPKSYFDLFSYFAKDENKDKRIALLPQSNPWGWVYYDWGLRGSGFLWYGIEQPIVDRAFDVWSNTSENFYWELTQALYSSNSDLFQKVLDKYAIDFVVIDKSVFSYTQYKSLYLEKLEEILSTSKDYKLDSFYSNIATYKKITNNSKYIELVSNISNINPTYSFNNFDQGYIDNGIYSSDNNNVQNTIYYPYRSLFLRNQKDKHNLTISDDSNNWVIGTTIPKELVGKYLVIPKINNISDEFQTPAQIYLDGELVPEDSNSENETKIYLPYISQGKLEVKIPKSENYNYVTDLTSELFNKQPLNCDQFNNGLFIQSKLKDQDKDFLRLTSIGSSNCIVFDLLDLSQKLGYIFEVEYRNIEGQGLLLGISNNNSFHATYETYLDKSKDWKKVYYIQAPMESYSLGYTIHLDNISIGKDKTINDIKSIKVFPMNHDLLSGIKITDSNLYPQSSLVSNEINVSHPNPSYYSLTINKKQITDNDYLVLSQAYDSGWKAYEVESKKGELLPFIFGKELKSHVIINSWANGWSIDMKTLEHENTRTIVIFYLPQLFEYLGFVILGLGLSFILLKNKKS